MTTAHTERRAERPPVAERVLAWFGASDDWERPLPENHARADAITAGVFAIAAALTMEIGRSLGALDGSKFAVWQQYLILLAGFVPLAFRRRWPIPMAVLCQAHYFALSYLMWNIAGQPVMGALWCVSLFTVVAWEKNRTAAAGFVAVMVVYMTVWVLWLYAFGNVIDQVVQDSEGYDRGVFGPVVAFVLYGSLMNVAMIVGTVAWAQGAWRSALRRRRLAEQAETIAAQADELAGRAVVEERLRIARELHDVVAHHVSVTGVQAGAARLALTKQPEAAAEALSHVEEASRTAVTQMRGLLGTLRRSGAANDIDTTEVAGSEERRATPTLADLPGLVASHQCPGFSAGLDFVDETGSVPGVATEQPIIADVPVSVGLAVYRIVQEALANVRRHSTAKQAAVVVRRISGPAGACILEVEVTDNGSPRGASTGTGLGQLGMRERAVAAGGTLEIGPRVVGGYRVRARLPLAGQ